MSPEGCPDIGGHGILRTEVPLEPPVRGIGDELFGHLLAVADDPVAPGGRHATRHARLSSADGGRVSNTLWRYHARAIGEGGPGRGRPDTLSRAMEIMGIRIPTVIHDTDSVRCAGCHEPIAGRPMRVSILDIVATETPPSWATRSPINPGPHEFHPDEAHVREWMRRSGYRFCRRSAVREIMRPVPLPIEPAAWGLCDGMHRDAHEFVPA